MQTPAILRSLVLSAAIALTPFVRADDPPPRVDALQVAKIASAYLATQKSAPYVVSIVFEREAIFNGTSSWIVRWSRPIVADGNTEVGMRVKSDGSVTYIVEGKSSPKKRASR